MDFNLPKPTEEELNITGKHEYFFRLLEDGMDLDKKFKITLDDLNKWIHHNYESIFLLNEELSYNKYKKLTK